MSYANEVKTFEAARTMKNILNLNLYGILRVMGERIRTRCLLRDGCRLSEVLWGRECAVLVTFKSRAFYF